LESQVPQKEVGDVVTVAQSRRHGGALVGLAPPNKASNPPN